MLRRQVWIANAVVGVAVLAAAGAIAAGAIALWPSGKARRVERALPAPAAGAYEHGGQPLADPALATLLERDLTELVISTDADRGEGGMSNGGPRAAQLAALLAPPAVTAHGPSLARAWADMISALDRWVYVPAGGRDYEAIVSTFKDHVHAVSDQLATQGLGYYLEGDVVTSGRSAHALIYAYRVEDVAFVLAHGERRRVLGLRRLDKLNFSHSLLGMQSEDLGDPVLLLDQIDEHVATHTFPAIAPGAPYPLGDPGWAPLAEAHAIRVAAGEVVRGELTRALGDDAAPAGAIGALLVERAGILDAWSVDLADRGYRMPHIETLYVPEVILTQVEPVVPHYQHQRVLAIEDELARDDAGHIAGRLEELVSATVRRHEAQHGVDADRDPPLPYPDALQAHIGAAEDRAGNPRNFADHCRHELSAYTSQIANDPVTPEGSYFQVAGFAFDRHSWGTPESYAAVLITEGLARHLGSALPDAPVIHGGEIDRGRLAAEALVIAHATPDALRAAARATWRDFYDEDATPITER